MIDLSNNCTSTTAWTNATTGHYYSINPYTYKDTSGVFIENNNSNGDIHINVDDDSRGIYQFNDDLKTRNVIIRYVFRWFGTNQYKKNLEDQIGYKFVPSEIFVYFFLLKKHAKAWGITYKN